MSEKGNFLIPTGFDIETALFLFVVFVCLLLLWHLLSEKGKCIMLFGLKIVDVLLRRERGESDEEEETVTVTSNMPRIVSHIAH